MIIIGRFITASESSHIHRKVFSLDLKEPRLAADLQFSGSWFQIYGAQKLKKYKNDPQVCFLESLLVPLQLLRAKK